MDTTARRRKGRPRDPSVERAILNATIELAAEMGFEGMSMEGVAARAGVGKTSIYRRWATKEELIAAAVRQIHATVPIVDTGNLRADLIEMARWSEDGPARVAFERLLPRFLAESASNSSLFAAYQDAVMAPRLRAFIERIERAIAQGEVRRDVDPVMVVDLLSGSLFFRWMITGRLFPPGPDFMERLIESIWSGIAAQT